MVYHENILCVTGSQLIEVIGNKNTYDTVRRKATVVKRACYGQPALIEFKSLPTKWRKEIETKVGNPEEKAATLPFIERIKPDAKAIEFYSEYILTNGDRLEAKFQKEYAANASVLNAIRDERAKMSASRKARGGNLNGFWAKALTAVQGSRVDVMGNVFHTLPGTENRLRLKFNDYVANGYEALISGKFCNDNSRKVNAEMVNLVMSIYTMPNKPFVEDVHSIYMLFLADKIQVINKKTGELFSPKNFREVSRQTIWNIINNPDNRSTVDIKRNSGHSYNNMHRPHHHRTAPTFSFSKISMDDRDLPRKLAYGDRVKAYYSYDVASGCVIGRAYSITKDEALFIDCMQDMFRLIERENLGMPLEVEVEHHLVNKFFDDLAFMFPFVRICNAGNSQEKRAEHLNRSKKYGVEKKTQNGIGRWWAKSEAYRVDQQKVNDEFVEKKFTMEQLVADDIAACNEFNNQLHPKQKKYPGKTRWQVLLENINPDVSQPNKAIVYKAIGEHTKTTITRNQYVRVQYAKYTLPDPALLQKLEPNNLEVDAYYLKDAEGMVQEVYLYQNGKYICQAAKIDQYNEAKAEWTEADAKAYTEQAKYVGKFDKRKKEQKNELASIAIEKPDHLPDLRNMVVKTVESNPMQEDDINELLNSYDPQEYSNRAKNSI